MTVLQRFFEGETNALAKIISHVEDAQDGHVELLDEIFKKSRKSPRIGITGPPGAGKSTILDGLIQLYINGGKKVGVIAVDPSSPFSGGALLGDRVRIQGIESGNRLYFRSMATRGNRGGLAANTDNVALVMDAFGFDIILIETVGVGQIELDIVDTCDTVVVVLVPESGDSVQTMKAGLLEIADILAVNKADRPGAGKMVKDLEYSLHLRNQPSKKWEVPVLATVASSREKNRLDRLYESISSHQSYLMKSGEFERHRKEQIKKKVLGIARERFQDDLSSLKDVAKLSEKVERIYSGVESPFQVGNEIYEIYQMKFK